MLAFPASVVAETPDELIAIRAAAHAALNDHDIALFLSAFTDNAVLDFTAAPAPFVGSEAIGAFFASELEAFPDWQATDTAVFAAENLVVAPQVITGTHEGMWNGIAATGNPVQLPMLAFVDFEGDKIKRLTAYADLAAQMVQLGVAPIPEMPPLVPSFEVPEPEPSTLSPLEASDALLARWNSGDLAGFFKMTHAEATFFDSGFGIPLGRDEYAAGCEMFLHAFPDMVGQFSRSIDLGDGWVAVEVVFTGTHNGPFMGVPATGRPTVLRAGSLRHFDADGLLTDFSLYYDTLGLMAQITAVTPMDPGGDGLVAYYALDGDASDHSGNGLNGTVMGDPLWIEGIMGGAVELDGDGDTIDCGNDARLDIPGPIGISLWIRPDADDPEGNGTETAPLAKAMNGMSPSWSWQVRYGWNSPQPYMAFTFNTSPRAWAYVGRNLEQGEWHHLACSHDGETLTAYLNGQATESTPMGAITSSSTPLLIGSDGWGDDWIGGIDEVRVYNRALTPGEIQFLTGYMPDVTSPGDVIRGVPNDGDWPGGETPDLALDDNAETKYLHFKGDFDPDAGPTGFQVKPGVGPTVVTGVTFTTANDVPGRDPVAFELYGSKISIDGPYTLIARRDIVDFSGAEPWPRFTKNATPIVLANDTAYTYYQLLITAIRGPVGDSVNSMQIAEVELFGKPLLPPSDVEANKEVARRFFEEMWNNRDLDLVEELISADMQGHAPTGEFVGYEGERQTILGTVAAFPDLVITIDEMIAEDNKVALLTSYHGTHTGTLMGQIPPTGAEIRMTGGILFHFAEGKIVEAWSFADMLGLMQQIGAASPPRPTPEDYAWLPPSPIAGDPGDPESNKTMVARFVEEVWNQANLDPIEAIFHPEILGNNPPVSYMYAPHNRETFTQSVADYLAAYPDMQVTLHDIVAEDDLVMAYWTSHATHGGELMGIPPTGNSVAFSGHTMYRFVDGQVVQTWWAWDTMGMMQQITPPPAAE
jgi:steroid delta-isomerase-like uncharacterized protein